MGTNPSFLSVFHFVAQYFYLAKREYLIQTQIAMPTANFKSFSISIPFLGLQGNWEVDDQQRKAAWEIYVELVTRVTVVELKENEGIIREALNSFYSLFNTTRLS